MGSLIIYQGYLQTSMDQCCLVAVKVTTLCAQHAFILLEPAGLTWDSPRYIAVYQVAVVHWIVAATFPHDPISELGFQVHVTPPPA